MASSPDSSSSASTSATSSSNVRNLIASVPEEFWTERWQKGEIGWHRSAVNDDLRKYSSLFQQFFNSTHSGGSNPSDGTAKSTHNCRVLVPLCGKSLDLVHLYESGYDVIGVEYVEKAIVDFFSEQNSVFPAFERKKINENMEIFSAKNGRMQIVRADFFDPELVNVLGPVDYVWDRASLVAIGHAADSRRKYVAQLYRILQHHSLYIGASSPSSASSSSSSSSFLTAAVSPRVSGGMLLPHILLEIFCYDQDIDVGPPFSQSDRQVRNLYGHVAEEGHGFGSEFPMSGGETFKHLDSKLKEIEEISSKSAKNKVYVQLLSDYQVIDDIKKRFKGPAYIRFYSIQFV